MCVAICIAVFVFTCNKFVLGLYTDEAAIITTGSSLLSMIALIQPFQASQFILAGALRGAGDTMTPMWISLMAKVLF